MSGPTKHGNYVVQGGMSDAELASYSKAMRGAKLQFIQDEPTHTITSYCVEEVRRQDRGWNAIEFGERVHWMLRAWLHATKEWAPVFKQPSANKIIILGELVEPDVNYKGFRRGQIGILASGGRVMPIGSDAADVLRHVVLLCEQWDALEPLEWYREFEKIHPFDDGNGRVGKILLNWRNGTLEQGMIFPPNDFWGDPIPNP